MLLANLHRWLAASCSIHLKAVADTASVAFLVEGIDKRDDTFMRAPVRVEARFTGPFTKRITKNKYRIRYAINVMVTKAAGGTAEHAYKFQEVAGAFHQALDGAIPILRCGNPSAGDDESEVGCLLPSKEGRGTATYDFAYGSDTVKEHQGVVDAEFTLTIED